MAESIRAQRPAGGDRPELDLSRAHWQSSGREAGDVQFAFVEGFVAMRNAAKPGSPSVVFDPAQWRAFVLNARAGAFGPA
ncbi:DUF397 domain-containing protein [Streptomyces hypolithicus]